MVCVEEVLHRVIVGWCGNDHEVGIAICLPAIESSREVKPYRPHSVGWQRLSFLHGTEQPVAGKKFLDILILYWRDTFVYFLNLLRHYVNSRDVMVLAQQSRYAQSDIASACHCYSDVFEIFHTIV